MRLLPGGASQEVAVEQLAVGDLVLVRPGARIAADGKVISGESSVDQAALTGESLPVLKQPGDAVMAGSVNLNEGALVVEVSRPASDCTLARMIRLVDEAQHNRAHTQVFTDWFGEHYTRFVILATIVSYFAFRSLGLEALGQDGALYRAMTLLVVASPCALVLATPAAILAAIASAARHGVLVKGGGCFEDIAAVRVVTFDKTGTLTSGRPRLERLIPLNGVSPDELLRLAASAERNSEHPVATAIVEAARQRGLELVEPTEFRAITGRGVIAQVGERRVIVGSPQLFCQEGFKVPGCPAPECLHRDLEGCRGLVVGTPEPVGRLDVLDSLRDDAPAAVSGLKAAGIGQVAMLTGDNSAAARAVAQAAGVDEVHANLLPAEKLDRLRELRERHGKVMMVGDGVNDAPALAAADVGVAMGGIGSDVALETADVVLTTDDLSRLPFLVALSRRTTRTVAQNLAVAIAVILVMGSLVLFTDGVKLPLAVVAHEGGTVLVILNGLRLLRD
ncbi:MAG: cation-translocating P-type ATPase [Armatimonadetes bacterium]|nr:cation-translocating P-type ATPase [Armatimonadota bacterium]